jgi:flagellar motor switch protein FliN/FliY
LASDISIIIQNELINTFESLLSVEATVDDIEKVEASSIEEEQWIKVVVKFE